MTLMFLLRLVDLRYLLDLMSLQALLAHHQDGLQLHHLLVIEKEWDGKTSRERLHLLPSPPEPQLIPIPMGDGEHDDDQKPQGERQRERSQMRARVHPHVQVPQEPQIQPMVAPESDDVSDEDSAVVESLITISRTTVIS